MANAIPAHSKADALTFLFGGSVVLKAILVDAGQYTRDDTTHHYLSDVPSAAISATSQQITNVTVATSGASATLDGDDAVCTQVLDSEPSAELVGLIDDTGTAATSRLLGWIDQDPTGATFTLTFNGSDWVIQWPVAGILAF